MRRFLNIMHLCLAAVSFAACGDHDKTTDDDQKDTYAITVQVSSECVGMGTVNGGGTFESGTKIVIQAIPNSGYKFVKWDDLNTEATRTIVVSQNKTYTAIFAANDTPAKILDSYEEKEFLEATAKEFLQYYNAANDFKNFTYIQKALENSDADEISDWAENIADNLKKYVSSSTNKYTDYITLYNCVYSAANFQGQFELTENTWKQTGSADGIKFTFSDTQGQKCVFSAKASGKETKVWVSSSDKYLGYNNGQYNFEQKDYYVMIPQHIDATLTQGSKTVLDMNVDVNISGMGSNGIADLNTTSFSVSADLLINGTYGIQVDKVSYIPNATIEGDISLSKDGRTLLTIKATGNGRIHENRSGDDDEKYGEMELSEVNQVTVDVDVLGKVQVAAGVRSGKKFYDYLKEAENNKYDESTFKRYVNNANSQLTAKLYNNSDFSSTIATVSLESFTESQYNSRWGYRPILNFSDNTSYSFDEYFDEISFDSVTKLAEDILNDFNNLFD